MGLLEKVIEQLSDCFVEGENLKENIKFPSHPANLLHSQIWITISVDNF